MRIYFLMLFLSLASFLVQGKDTLKVGVEYSRDTVFDFYHPRHWAVEEGDTVVFENVKGFNTTAPKNPNPFFPNFSTTPTNPFYQFSLPQGVYPYFNQSSGPANEGVVYVNPAGTSCSIDFSIRLDSSDPTGASFYFELSQNTSWSVWDFNDGILSSDSLPKHTFQDSGVYFVAVTVQLPNGCFASSMKKMVVEFQNPSSCIPNFSIEPQDSNQALLINQSLNLSQNDSLSWYLNGSTFLGIGDSLWISFPDTGWYWICLNLNGPNCQDSICQPYYAQNLSICEVDFQVMTDSSHVYKREFMSSFSGLTNPSFYWDFGDGATSNDPNPQHLFPGPGDYEVCLTVFESGGCQVGFCDTLSLDTAFCPIDFSYTSNAPLEVDFNLSPALPLGTNYYWSFGPGQGDSSLADPQGVSFPSGGKYEVCLTTVFPDGCIGNFCDSVEVMSNINCQVSFTSSANFDLISFSAQGLHSANYPLSFTWDYGDGSTGSGLNSSHRYASEGSFLVCLNMVDSAGICTASFCDSVNVSFPNCSAGFSSQSLSWKKFRFWNQSTSNGSATFQWSFGNGSFSYQENPVFTFPGPGAYPVCLTLTDSLSCSSTFCDTLVINYPVSCHVDFDLLPMSNNRVLVLNKSVNPGNPGQYLWDFGDGNTGIGDSIVHSFSGPGVYDIRLSYSYPDIQCDTALVKTHVLAPNSSCYALFRPLDQGGGLYKFSVYSGGSGSIVQADWDFGDGVQFSGLYPPNHQYLKGGVYPVCLNVQTNQGCQYTFCDSIVVPNIPCQGRVNSSHGSQPYSANLNAQAEGAGGFQYSWNLGPATPATANTQQVSNVIFPGPGQYPISLLITDSTGCQSLVLDTLEYQAECSLDFSFQYLGNGLFQFQNLSTGQSLVSQFEWDFGDGGAAFLPHPQHQYQNPGLYTVEVVLKDTLYGCTDTLRKNVFIPTPCQAIFTHSIYAQTPQEIFFDASPSLGSGGERFVWNFGDGNLDTGATQIHTYAKGGWYWVKLEVEDSTGCQSVDSSLIQVRSIGICDADFILWPDSSQGEMMSYEFQAAYYGSPNAIYTWDFGDGVSYLGSAHESHTFSSTGWFDVCLKVEDTTLAGAYCVDSLCISVYADTLYFKEVPQFSYKNVGNFTILFTNESVRLGFPNTHTSQLKYTWDFGDGTYSNLYNTAHTYTHADTFEVCLTIEDLSLGLSRAYCQPGVETSREIGIEEVSFDLSRVYPNPSSDQFRVELSLQYPSEISWRMIDAFGRVVKEGLGGYPSGISSFEISGTGLETGFYFLQIQDLETGYTQVEKLIFRP